MLAHVCSWYCQGSTCTASHMMCSHAAAKARHVSGRCSRLQSSLKVIMLRRQVADLTFLTAVVATTSLMPLASGHTMLFPAAAVNRYV
jgi:hypothetical protein